MSQQMHDNPNFMDQMNEWQQKRSERNEDPMDWNEFRDHLMRIGAPDPGFIPTNEFTAFQPSGDQNAAASAAASGAISAAEGLAGGTHEEAKPQEA